MKQYETVSNIMKQYETIYETISKQYETIWNIMKQLFGLCMLSLELI